MSQISDSLDLADAPEEQLRPTALIAPTAAARDGVSGALEAGASAAEAGLAGVALAMASAPMVWGPQSSAAALLWDGQQLRAWDGPLVDVCRSLDAGAFAEALGAAADALGEGVLISAKAAAAWKHASGMFSPAPAAGQHWRSEALGAELRALAVPDAASASGEEPATFFYRGHPIYLAGKAPASLKALALLEEYSLRDLPAGERMHLTAAAVGFASGLDDGAFADLDGLLDRLDALKAGAAPAAPANEVAQGTIAVVDGHGRAVLIAAASAKPFGGFEADAQGCAVRAAMVFRADHPFWMLAPNGLASGLVPSIVELVDGRRAPEAFVREPGWSFAAAEGEGSTFELELGFDDAVAEGLRGKGHGITTGSRSRAMLSLDEMLVPTALEG